MHWFCNVASNSPSPVSLAQISSGSGRMLVVRDAPNTSPNSGATGRFTASLAAHLETEFTHAVTGQPSDWNANVSTQQQHKTLHGPVQVENHEIPR
jgi:hypothetical protein